MTKNIVISKTLLFIFIVGFVVMFKSIFGEENTLIGVTVITATLMFLERDLTSSLLSKFIKIVLINLLLGVLSFFASQNIWIGLIFNFIALFIVGYFFNYELRKPMYIPFGLQYLFMLSTPINIEQLPMRLSSLVFGAAFIILVQLILNKNKLQKLGERNISLICDELRSKIELIKDNKNTNTCDEKIDVLSKELKRIIYDNRKGEFYITNRGMNLLNILFSLERVNLIISKYEINDTNQNLYMIDHIVSRDIKELEIINNELGNIKERLKDNSNIKIEYIKSKELIDNVNLNEIYILLENIYENIDKHEVNNIKTDKSQKIDIPNHFKPISVHKRNFHIESLRLSYALKIGLLTSISGFIMDYFNLQDGRWIMYTVFSLTQTYSENCLLKSKQRIEATLIGSCIFFVLFTIIKDQSIRGLIVILSGYISSYLNDYKKLIICVTISALCSAAITSSVDIAILSRVIYVILGAIISVLANRYILPYDAKKGHKDLINIYININKEIAKEIKYGIKNEYSCHSIKNLLLIPTLIEDRLLLVNKMFEDKKEESFIDSQKKLTSDMYYLYMNIKKSRFNDESIVDILDDLIDTSNSTQKEYEYFEEDVIY